MGKPSDKIIQSQMADHLIKTVDSGLAILEVIKPEAVWAIIEKWNCGTAQKFSQDSDFKDIVQCYLSELERRGRGAGTISRYKSLLGFLNSLKLGSPPAKITAAFGKSSENAAASTRKSKLDAAKTFFNWLVSKRLFKSNPFKNIL